MEIGVEAFYQFFSTNSNNQKANDWTCDAFPRNFGDSDLRSSKALNQPQR